MNIDITETGEFDLELFSYQTDLRQDVFQDIMTGLGGLARSWTVTIHDPNENEPNGRVSLRHSSFDEHTEVVVTSTHGDQGRRNITYDVYRHTSTDIHTEVEDTPLYAALAAAVEAANRERRRQSLLLPPYTVSVPNPLTTLRS